MTSLTQRDASQIERHEHDEAIDAKRVYIVGGEDIKLKADTSEIVNSVASAVREGLADLAPLIKPETTAKPEVIIIKEPQIVEIEKQVIVKELQVVELEKQIVVKEKEIVYVDKPVIIEHTVYKEVEKPILKESDSKQKQSIHPMILVCVVIQTLMVFGLIILKK